MNHRSFFISAALCASHPARIRLVLLCAASLPLSAAPLFDPAKSAFADRPADSYANYRDADGKPVPLIWGQAPLRDFGSRAVTFDANGARAVRPMPAPGIHPRIYFGPDDLPDVRNRLKDTRAGKRAWNNILAWTEMMKGRYDDTAAYAQPDMGKGGFGGLRGPVPLYRLGVPRENGAAYNKNPNAAAIYRALVDGTATDFPGYYWNVFSLEAFRCLIANDEPAARELAKATLTAMKLDQAKRDIDRAAKQAKNSAGPLPPPEQPVGTFQLAFTYDFLFKWLTPEQRTAIHAELAANSWSHDNYGTFNGAEGSRSNWATFSYWLFQVLAIEGEPGFNDLKVRGMYRGWRNLFTYGWYPSGATFEGEAKNQLGMDGIIPFLMRQEAYGFDNLVGHPYLRAYATKFLPHSSNPMQNGFHKYDLLGGSRAGKGGFTPADIIGLKYMFPGDKVINWVYRQSMGENYEGVPDRPDGYFNGLLFAAIFATDYEPANDDPAKLGLGNTFFCGERALMMTRSGWDKEASMLNLHVRQANGGHAFADRNAIMVAGAGRVWSPNGYASFRTFQNSVVVIDGKSQSENTPGRLLDFVDKPLATFAVGDAKFTWDWTWKTVDPKKGAYTAAMVRAGQVELQPGWELETHTANDFSYTKQPYAYLDVPISENPHWVLPKGIVRAVARKPNYPVEKAFRTAGLVRGASPYMLVVDDIKKDDTVRRYDWTLALEPDIQIARVVDTGDGGMEIYLTGADPDQKTPRAKATEMLPARLDPTAVIPPGQPVLLVRVLNRTLAPSAKAADLAPKIIEQPPTENKYTPVRCLIIPADSVSPEFKVLLYAFRMGDPRPTTKWNAQRSAVGVELRGVRDVIAFAPSASGKTHVTITRDGAAVIAVNKEPLPLK